MAIITDAFALPVRDGTGYIVEMDVWPDDLGLSCVVDGVPFKVLPVHINSIDPEIRMRPRIGLKRKEGDDLPAEWFLRKQVIPD